MQELEKMSQNDLKRLREQIDILLNENQKNDIWKAAEVLLNFDQKDLILRTERVRYIEDTSILRRLKDIGFSVVVHTGYNNEITGLALINYNIAEEEASRYYGCSFSKDGTLSFDNYEKPSDKDIVRIKEILNLK
ncbi:hypothetical protein [Sulfurospirillum sp. hDNRA2]|uniref:hypothetical protein n=1 Tax=Sulfurospirillum sp. hDNRA2 TaxID=3237298 RepID=UPI0020B890E9|nr:hypothetical protein [Sulfurospirillum sp. DNRA8]MCP3653255.1 hypothetical protein [Sulfurospirillum sp. DNRA8]MCR1812107.1 hypothetical protein [Sulfurospirillum sp. DNRA8]